MLREKCGITLRMLFIASIMGGVTACRRGRRGERAQHPDNMEGNTAEKRRCCILLENALGRLLDFFPGPGWIQWFVSHGVSEIKYVQLLDQHRQASTL